MTATLFDLDAHGAAIGLDEPGAVAHDAPATSAAAAAMVRAGTQALRLLRLVAAAGPAGLTGDEAEPAMSEGRQSPMSPNQVCSRMGDLRNKHLVDTFVGVDGEEITRPTRRGAPALVYIATRAGLDELARHLPDEPTPPVAPSRTSVAVRPDVARWLARRAAARADGAWPRWHGASSDALVNYALGTGPRPTVPGRPAAPGLSVYEGDERGDGYPRDRDDLLACILTHESAPDDLRRVMAPVVAEFRGWVLERRNRYGERVTA